MTDTLTNLFHGLPPVVAVFLLAMLPIAELRASLPIGVGAYHLSFWSAFLASVLGNILIVAIVLALLPWFVRATSRWHNFERFWQWLFTRTRRKFATNQARYGLFVGLLIFVAIPLPVTGGWTGAVAAFLFGMPYRRALAAISLGVIVAGIIVGAVSVGAFSIFR